MHSCFLKINLPIVFLIIIALRITQTNNNVVLYRTDPLNDISCHKKEVKGDFPSVDKNTSLPLKSIFFIETSCKGGIDSKQACSIESAAIAHPRWQINVLFAGPVSIQTQQGDTITQLQQYGNIKFSRMDVIESGKGTPLEYVYENNVLNSSAWSVMHSADLLRYLALYKWGGVYLHLDVIVIRPFEPLAKNWVGKQSTEYIAAGLISARRDRVGRKFATALLGHTKHIMNYFKRFDVFGPHTVMSVLANHICHTCYVAAMSEDNCNAASYCLGCSSIRPKVFLPHKLPRLDAILYERVDLKDCYTHHLWNYFSHPIKKVPEHSMFAQLATQFCPTIFNLYNSIDEFGS